MLFTRLHGRTIPAFAGMTEGVRDEVSFTGDGWRGASLLPLRAAPGEQALARLYGEVGEKQRNSGTGKRIEPGPFDSLFIL